MVPPAQQVIRLPKGFKPTPNGDNFIQKRLVDTLEAMPVPLDDNDVPIDLRKRPIREYSQQEVGTAFEGKSGTDLTNEYLRRIMVASEMIASTLVLQRGLIGRSIPISTVRTSIVRAEYLRGYIFLNPAASVGLTTFRTVKVLGAEAVAGNTQSDSIGVANFSSAHFFIDVTANTGTLEIFLQVFDPLSLNWVDGQLLLSTITTGTFYVPAGDIGIVTDMATRWTVTASATFSIGMVLKGGLAGSSSSGLSQTVYLGPAGVTPSNGFPLLEGQSKSFFLKENIELFGVGALDGLSLRIFEL